jgi:hypothetical protein
MNLNSSLKDLELLKRFAKLTGDPSNQKRVDNAERAHAFAVRLRKLTGRRPPAGPPAIRPVPSLLNGPVNTRSNEQKVRAYLARLQRADPQNVNEIARVQRLLPTTASTSFGTYPLPRTSASTGFGAVSPPATSVVPLSAYHPASSALSITFPETMTRVDQEATANHVLAAISKNEKSIVVPAGVTITLTPVAKTSSPAGGAGSSSSPATFSSSKKPESMFKENLLTTPTYLIKDPKRRLNAELAQAIAKIPTGPVKGGRSRRLKSKRNKRTRRHVR